MLQTSHDGWFCATPLATLTDDRDAMLAVAMNGRPLPIEHGFPVRTIVPGLYGYVSATKWVVDYEVTHLRRRPSATGRPRAGRPRGRSRSPRASTCRARVTTCRPARSPSAASPGTSTPASTAVEVQVDGGAWERAELGEVPSVDTWVQWAVTARRARGRPRGAGAGDRQGRRDPDERRTRAPTPTGRPGCTRSRSAPPDPRVPQPLRMTYAVPPEAAIQIRSNCARS